MTPELLAQIRKMAEEQFPDVPPTEYNYVEMAQRRAFVAGAIAMEDLRRWIPVSQFVVPNEGQIILFSSHRIVRMWTWSANNDEPPSSWATHYQFIDPPAAPPQPEPK